MVTHADHNPTRTDATADSFHSALATLGLEATADENLIEIAYWCLVELARTDNAGGSVPPPHLTRLNEARSLVHARSDLRRRFRSASAMPEVHVSRPSIVWWAVVVAALIPFVSLALYALALREWGVGRDVGGLGWLYVMAIAGVISWAVLIRAPHALPEVTVTLDEAHQILHLLPTAPTALVALSHQYLSIQARCTADDHTQSLLNVARAVVEASRRTRDCAGHDDIIVSRESDLMPERAAPMVDFVPQFADTGRLDDGRATHGIRSVPLRGIGRLFRPSRRVSRREQADTSVTDAPGDLRAIPETHDQVRVLMIRRSGELVQRLILSEGSVYTIGSAPTCQIRLASAVREGQNLVADEHARLAIRRGGVLFHHLATNSASHVNGDACTWAILEPGDEISIGEYRCRYICTE